MWTLCERVAVQRDIVCNWLDVGTDERRWQHAKRGSREAWARIAA